MPKLWMPHSLPLFLRKTVYCCEPAIQLSRVVGLTEGTTVAGSKMVSTPSVTVPSDAEISIVFRVHVVLGFTAPSNRHLKHDRTPPSTVSIVLPEILNVSTHPVCELTVEKKGGRHMIMTATVITSKLAGILKVSMHPVCELPVEESE